MRYGSTWRDVRESVGTLEVKGHPDPSSPPLPKHKKSCPATHRSDFVNIHDTISKLADENKQPYVFLFRSNDPHLTVQFPHSEEIRPPFGFEDLWMEGDRATGRFRYADFQIADVQLL